MSSLQEEALAIMQRWFARILRGVPLYQRIMINARMECLSHDHQWLEVDVFRSLNVCTIP